MTAKFQIQNLIEQSQTRTVHRVRGSDGTILRLTRILLEEDDREHLKRSQNLRGALAELKALRHSSLTEVLDCGLDEKGIPWVMSRWEKGKLVSEIKIEEREIQTVSKHANRLLNDFGRMAGVVNFDTAEIFFSGESPESCVFQIDYFRWFSDIAAGISPGTNYDAKEQVRQLLASLAIKQLKFPKKKEETNPIPFVDERSPALRIHEPVGEPWFGRLLIWLCLIGALVAIGWLTVEGMRRVRENPRAVDWKVGERP
nr:hypothetical protein [bacterium]